MAKQKTDRYTKDLFETALAERQVKRVSPPVAERAAAFRARIKFNMLKCPTSNER